MLLLFFKSAGAATYTLTCEGATYALTGGDVAFKVSRKLVLSGGTFSLTGGDVAFKVSRKLVLSGGTYALTGGDVAFKVSRKLTLGGGTFAFTGGDVAFTYTPVSGATYTLVCEGGTFSLTGGDVDFVYTRRVSQNGGGGWLPSLPTKREREDYIRRQREALGIIPKRIQPIAKTIKKIAKRAAKLGIEPSVEQVREIEAFQPIDTQAIADALAINYRIYLALLDKDRQERERTRQFIEQQIEQAKANAIQAARLQEEEEVFVVMSLLLAD